MPLPSKRLPPRRTPSQWAGEFIDALGFESGGADFKPSLTRIAAADIRLRERLPASVAKIARRSARAAGLPLSSWLGMAKRYRGFLTVQDEAVHIRLKELTETLRINRKIAVRLVQKEPSLLCFKNGALAHRAGAHRRALGLTAQAWRACLIKHPGLLACTTETLKEHISRQKRALRLTSSGYREMIATRPDLLKRSPVSIETFLRNIVRHWGFGDAEARSFAANNPRLLCSGRFETMDRNIESLARGLKVDKADIIAAVRRFSPLAYQNPDRIIISVSSAAHSLCLPRPTLILALLRSPSLFVRKQDLWGRSLRLAVKMARALGKDITAAAALEMFPPLLTYAHRRLLQRYVVAKLGLWTRNWPALLTFSDEKIRKLMRAYFAANPKQAPLRKALRRRGLI